jgi:hypothetical protein
MQLDDASDHQAASAGAISESMFGFKLHYGF